MKYDNMKLAVREKYGEIAKQSKSENESSCCGATSCCSTIDYAVFSENYKNIVGYNPEADLGLGCGIPTQFAGIEKGNRVLDLGSGAGNDCFVASTIVGDEGHVTGLDFTESMVEKANQNKAKTGIKNIDFVQGDIEEMPFESNLFDVIISNCVLNLVSDKSKAFSKIFRVLKPGGHFCISDVVIVGQLPEKLRNDAEMYAGCVSGALDKDIYINIIETIGFQNIEVHKLKSITIPEEILVDYLDAQEIDGFKQGNLGIFSITVSAAKV